MLVLLLHGLWRKIFLLTEDPTLGKGGRKWSRDTVELLKMGLNFSSFYFLCSHLLFFL